MDRNTDSQMPWKVVGSQRLFRSMIFASIPRPIAGAGRSMMTGSSSTTVWTAANSTKKARESPPDQAKTDPVPRHNLIRCYRSIRKGGSAPSDIKGAP